MFLINNYNKMLLSKGDTATFDVSITDLDDEVYVPSKEDELQFLVYDSTDVHIAKAATLSDGVFTVSLDGSDTAEMETGFYTYEVRLISDGAQYTVVFPSIFELAGEFPPVVTPTPEPEPEPDIDLDPDPVDGPYVITFGNPVCYAGDNIVVKMKVNLIASSLQMSLAYSSDYLQMTGYSGGLGNASINYNGSTISINDYSSTGADIALYEFSFKALKVGTGFVRTSVIDEIADENGDPYVEIGSVGESIVTIKAAPSASSEARLQSLTISPGTWDKAFDPDTTDYTISITSSDTELSLQYTTMDSNATVAYWPYSEAGKLVIDTEGENEFTIRCTAQDGRATVDYHITVLILT